MTVTQFNAAEFLEEPSENPDLGKADGRGTDGTPVSFRLYITYLSGPGMAECVEYAIDGEEVNGVIHQFSGGAHTIIFSTEEGDIVGIPRSGVYDFAIETITATNVIPFRRK